LCNATSNWEDQGFPAGLSTDKAKYQGTRKEGENKQRAMTAEEMRVLFEGDLMRRHANDPAEVHRFWLPVIGLHTGARVNEICQINPQVDVFKDVKTGAWCMKLTEDTEAGEGIEKTVKNDSSDRTIPVHPKLVELGFIDYVMALRAARVDRIFPAWKPRLSDGRASPAALKAFGDMQRDVGLHGVKNEAGKALRGMHSFRFTLLTYGNEAGVNLECITGHAPVSSSGNESAAGYLDQTILMDMSKKIERLSALDYGLNFPKPVLPATSVKRRYKPRKSAKGNAAEK
jgi:integrase